MKIVVVSDTHRDTDFIDRIQELVPNARYYLHAGDSQLEEFLLYPFRTVKGNCDTYNRINNRILIVSVLGINILVVHGDNLILDPYNLSMYAKEYDSVILIHGHTHKPYYEYCNGVHIVCPGSLTKPRSLYPSYAIINIDEQTKLINVEIKKYEIK